MEVSQKKNIMYVYKLASGNQSSAIDSPGKPKKAAPRAIWQLRKSKTYREHDQTVKVVAEEEGRRDGSNKIFEGRKSSASNIEARKSATSIIEARRSVSYVEAPDSMMVAKLLQVKVLVSDMPGFMQVHAFRCARRTYDSLENFSSKQMAFNMKKEFDKVYGPAWHCIVGSSFGSFVTHSTGCFLYFSIEKIYILIFKTKVQRALDLNIVS